ncbi:MAG: hypothetical protein GWN58_06765, partial [Anaerolineae bacterium]|nr:hypothetical protein [Anaerolineae bacterium]
PGFMQRRENSRNEDEAVLIASQLVDHARFALQDDNLDAARQCLDLSLKLDESTTASELLAEVDVAEQANRKNMQQEASRKKATIQREQSREEKKKT